MTVRATYKFEPTPGSPRFTFRPLNLPSWLTANETSPTGCPLVTGGNECWANITFSTAANAPLGNTSVLVDLSPAVFNPVVDQVFTLTVDAPTLSVSLTPSPSSGLSPLSTTLTANVGGTATGNITYTFNCNNGTPVQTFTTTNTQQTANCSSYTSTDPLGTSYAPNVSVTRQGQSVGSLTGVYAYPQSSVDIKANGSNGPVSLISGQSANLTWTSTYSSTCTSSGSWGVFSKSLNNSTGESTGALAAGTYTYTLTCGNPAGSVSDTVVVNVTQPPAFDYSISNNSGITVIQGQSGNNTITATLTSGTTQAVSFSASNLPTGASASFSPTSCNPTCASTLTISTSASTPTGNSTITVTGSPLSKTTAFTLTVNPSFDYSLSNSGNVSVSKPNQVSVTITATKNNGTAQAISFSASGLPTGIFGGGATASFSPTSCTPTGVSTSCTSTLTISTTSNTNIGPFTVTVTGSPLSKTTSFTLTVYQASMTIEPSLGNVMVDNTLQLRAYYDADGSSGPAPSQEITNSANWSSSNTQKATVNNTTSKGLVTGQSPSNAVSITASYNTSSAAGALSVTAQPVLTCAPDSNNPSPAFTNQNLTFTSTGGTGNYQWAATGGTPSTGGGNSQNIFTTKFSAAGAKTITVSSGSSQSANCTVNVQDRTLSVTSLTPSPASGNRPLNGVDLTATPSANLPGTLNYTFYCNRSDSGINVTLPAAAKFDGITDNPKMVVDVCNYSAAGTYTTKVIVEGGGLAAEKRTAVTVGTPTLSVALSANPASSQNGSLATDLTATVSGSAPGTMNYSMWWDCAYPSASVSEIITLCGNPTDSRYGVKFDAISETTKLVNHYYPVVGAYAAKVIVERDSLSAEKRFTVNVEAPPNSAPTVTPSTPQAPADYCQNPFSWTLGWNFSDPGQLQSAYQLTITDTSTGQVITDTGRINSGSSSYGIPLGILAFNKTYSWTIKVWDNDGWNILSSSAVGGSNFTTIKHTAPAVNFRASSNRPAKDELVIFNDLSVVSGGATVISRLWEFPLGANFVSPYSNSTFPTGVKFSSQLSNIGANIKLTVVDSDNLQCVRTYNQVCKLDDSDPNNDACPAFGVGRGIPRFKEVIPQ